MASRGRSRGGDVSLPAPMPQEMMQSTDGGAGRRSGRTRGGDIGQRAARAAEIGGETDIGNAAGGVAAFQRLKEMLDRKKGVLAKDFFLSDNEYFQFWSDISRDEVVTSMFLANLVWKLREVEKNIAGTKKGEQYVREVGTALYGGDQARTLLRVRNALLSSIYFVQLHFPFEIRTDGDSDDLKDAMVKWRKRLPSKAGDTGTLLPASAEFAIEVYNLVEEKGARLGDDTFSAITDQLESVVHIETKRGLNVPFTMPAQIEEETVGPAWAWMYLRHLFDTPAALNRALNEMVDMLRVHNTEHRLLCLLQMLTEIIHSYPALPSEPLRRLIAALDPFYCWPCPFGPLAQRLIATAEREIASPGAGLRNRYLLECPSLAVKTETGESRSCLWRPVVPVLFGQDSTNSHFLRLSLTTPPSSGSSPRGSTGASDVDAAAKMLLHILQRAGAQVLELPSNAAEVIQQHSARDPEALLAWYEAARRVDLAAQQRRTEAAAAELENLGPIGLELFGDAMASHDSPWKRPRRPTRTVSTAQEPQHQPDVLPSLEPLTFVLQPEGPCEDGSVWPTEQVLSTCSWLKGVADEAPAGADLRIAVAGGTRTIHHLVNAIERLRREDSIDRGVCIYLIPVAEDNALADLISRTDCWYGRHVAIPWSTLLPAFPHVRPDSAAQPEPEPEPEYAAPAETRDGQPSLAPCMAMRTLIQNYIRHASNRLEVRVYCCQCSPDRRGKGTAARSTIYFCDRVSFGSDALEPAPSKTKAMGTEPLSPPLVLEFGMVGFDGQIVGPGKKYPEACFRTLDVSNVPRRGQTTACPSPSDPALALVSATREMTKKKKKGATAETVDLVEHVYEVKVTAPPKSGMRFFMVADGIKYGPFAEVEVSEAGDDGKDAAAALHVMTYFPLSQ